MVHPCMQGAEDRIGNRTQPITIEKERERDKDKWKRKLCPDNLSRESAREREREKDKGEVEKEINEVSY